MFTVAAVAAPAPMVLLLDLLRTWPLLGTVLLLVVPLYWPTSRWTRRLRADSDIYSKLPEGPERDRYGRSIVEQAWRLREYRETIGRGKYLARTVLAISALVGAASLLLLFPESLFADGWQTLFLAFAHLGFVVLIVHNIWRGGTPFHGLTSHGVRVRERLRRRRKRARVLSKLEKKRAKLSRKGQLHRGTGSDLGFREPVDDYAEYTTAQFRRVWGDLMVNHRTGPQTYAAQYWSSAWARAVDRGDA